MDLGLSPEQRMLQTSARSFLEKECTSVFVRQMRDDPLGHSPALFRKMAEMGWQSALIPEEYGGSGGNAVDLMVFSEEAGRVLLPAPFVSTAVVGATLILNGGQQPLRDELLPRIADGEEIVADALFEGEDLDPEGVATVARPSGDGFLLSGRKQFARDVHIANHLAVLARTGTEQGKSGLSLFLVDASAPGITSVPLKSFGGDRPFDVTFSDVPVPGDHLLGNLNEGWQLLQPTLRLARLAVCADLVGIAQRVLEMCLEHSKVRQQFGRPIGSFQALQHKMADMYIGTDSARLMVYQAAALLAEGADCDLQLSMAKAYTAESCYFVVHEGHHIFGGTSFMKIHDIHLYLGRAKYDELAYGDPDQMRDLVIEHRYLTPHPIGHGRSRRWWEPIAAVRS